MPRSLDTQLPGREEAGSRPWKWPQAWALRTRNLGLRPGGTVSHQTSNFAQAIWPLEKRDGDTSYRAAVRIKWEMTTDICPLQAQVTTGNVSPSKIIDHLSGTQLSVMISINGYRVPTPSYSCSGPATVSDGELCLQGHLTGEQALLGSMQSPVWNPKGHAGAAAGTVSKSMKNFTNVQPSFLCWFI